MPPGRGGVTREGVDGCETGVARRDAIASIDLEVIEDSTGKPT